MDSPSLLMPILRHFLSLQYWHWFLWCWSMGQFLFPLQEYVRFLLTDLLKKDLQPVGKLYWFSFWLRILEFSFLHVYLFHMIKVFYLMVLSSIDLQYKTFINKNLFDSNTKIRKPFRLSSVKYSWLSTAQIFVAVCKHRVIPIFYTSLWLSVVITC